MLNERIAQYRITGRLGQGGMGEIFSAHDEKLNRTVAIKFIAARIDGDAARRLFLREARAAAALNHPFICTVHDVLDRDGQPIIVMEYVEGETLQERVSKGPMPPEIVVQYVLEIVEALAAAHARGIVHRDVKTANVMLTPSGHVKVMDFGLAMMLTASPEETTMSFAEERRTRIAGTLPYMSPEILRGEGASASSDLYALGVVAYEMLAGRRPFRGKTEAVLMSEILGHAPAPLRQLNPAIPAALDDLVMRMLSKEPAERPSAGEVMTELRSAAAPKRPHSQSLAVLPFRALTADAENAHLGIALADATTSELALVRSLTVRPTAAILRFHDAIPDTLDAARELAVDFIVTGTFQRAGARIRVTVQLVNAAEGRPLWSTKIDTTLDDTFAMQDEVSRKIVEALEVELTSADEKRLAKRPQASGEVLDWYIKGRVGLLRETIAEVNAAIECFERALAIDPDHAPTLAALGDAYSRLAYTWDPEGGWYERALEISQRLLALEPEMPEGHYLRGRLAWTPQAGFQHEYAMREIVAALAERPNFSEGFDSLATVLLHLGLNEEAREFYMRSVEINPDEMLARSHAITCDWLFGNYEVIAKAARELPERLETAWGTYLAACANLRLGDLATSAKIIDAASRKFPANVLLLSARCVLAALQGNPAAAVVAIERVMGNRRSFGHFHHVEIDVACALAILGRADEAMDHLESGVRSGFPSLPAIANDPLLAALHSHPRFVALTDELRREDERYARVFAGMRAMISS